MTEHKIPIPSMLYNAAVGGHVTNSKQIIDENLNREQQDINEEVAAVPYNATAPNGMGKIVLKKNDNFKQVVEAQIDGNTIFVIKYDFILTGNVTIPANCILKFDGGSISASGSNDTITGVNTGIQAGLVNIFNNNVILAGTWKCKGIYPEWFGAISDTGYNVDSQIIDNNTDAIQKSINSFDTIIFSGIYFINNTITIQKEKFTVIGDNWNKDGIYMITDNIPIFKVIHNGTTFPGIQGTCFENLSFTYKNVQLGNNNALVFSYISETPGTGQHGWGWYNSYFKNIRCKNCYSFITTTTEPLWGLLIENIYCNELCGNFIDTFNVVGGQALNIVNKVLIQNQSATSNKARTQCFIAGGEWHFSNIDIEGWIGDCFRSNGGYMYVDTVHAEGCDFTYFAMAVTTQLVLNNVLINNCYFRNNAQNMCMFYYCNNTLTSVINISINNLTIDYQTEQKISNLGSTFVLLSQPQPNYQKIILNNCNYGSLSLITGWLNNKFRQPITINGKRQGMYGDNTLYPDIVENGENYFRTDLSKQVTHYNGHWYDGQGTVYDAPST